MLEKVKNVFKAATSFDEAKKTIRERNKAELKLDPEDFESINPIHSIENDFIFSKDGMVYRGYKLGEQAYEKSDEQAFQRMAEALDQSYRELPIGACVHRHSPFYNVYYNESKKNFELDLNRFFDSQKKINLIESPICENDSYVFIGLSANLESTKRQKSALNTIFALGGGLLFNDPFKNLDYVLESIDDIIQRFFARLGVLGVKHRKLETAELKQVIKKYLNVDYSISGGEDLKVNYSNKLPYLQAGNKLIGIVSFNGELQEVKSSIPNEYGVESSFNHSLYFGLRFPHVVNQYVYVRDQTQVLSEIEEKTTLMGGTDADIVIAQSMKGHVNDVRSNNQKLLDFGTNVICYSTKESELNLYLENASNAVMAMGKGSAQIEVIEDAANVFFSSIPGSIHNNYKRYSYPSLYCGCLTTFPGQYYSGGDFIVKGRDGRPVFIRIQPEDIKSSNNWVVVGPTGGGKSVFVCVKMAHYLERGDEVMIVDKGGSYKTLAKLFDLRYYDFTDLEKVDLNFFNTIKDAKGKYDLTQDKKDGIISVLRLLWKMDQKGALTQREKLSIEVILDMFYESVNQSGNTLIMDNFVRFVKEVKYSQITDRLEVGSIELEKYFDKEEFLLSIARYSSKTNGYNGKIFNYESSDYFKNGISAVYDIANIAQNPDLYSVFTVSLSNVILQGMYNRRHVRKHLVYDESSEALPGDQGTLLRMLFREVRKENGDVGIIVQLITDIVNNPNGQVILDNAVNRYLLDHTMATGTLPEVQKALQLSEHKFQLLKSLNRRPSPKYREFFLQRLNEASVYALELPESLRMAVSTSADDQKVFADLMKRISDPKLALSTYVEELKQNKSL